MQTGLFQLLRFGIVGASATAGHFIVALTLMRTLDLSVPLANAMAFLAAFFVSFSGHYFWTFRSAKRVLPTAVRFFAVAMIATAVSTCLALTLDAYTPWHDTLKLALAVIVIPSVSFAISKIWIF
ncbi:GtrA family protein [Pelagibius sp.]|uniref:GtrA family protein n=1 Tax=Pelagibius sp. TaxID=1931238 RepID=UPI003BB08B24